MNLDKKLSQVFKGYPLLEFVDRQAFSLDHVLRGTSLKAEIERHINQFSVGEHAENSGGRPRSRGIRPERANPNGDRVATDGHTSQSFEDQVTGLLDGLYLGCFASSVVQPDAGRPPQSYIWDIGFNTDKPTGFIVANPFDTLVTFGPRGRQVPYTVADPGVIRMPRIRDIKVAPATFANPRGSNGRAGIHNNTLVTSVGIADPRPDATDNPPRPSIICDLNIRVIKNHRQEVQLLSLFGDTLKIHLSKGLVQPVVRSGDKWVKTGRRLGFAVGTRVVTLRRNRIPTWGGPIDLGGATVFITSSNLVGQLHRVDLGGTPAKPLIVFDGVGILT